MSLKSNKEESARALVFFKSLEIYTCTISLSLSVCVLGVFAGLRRARRVNFFSVYAFCLYVNPNKALNQVRKTFRRTLFSNGVAQVNRLDNIVDRTDENFSTFATRNGAALRVGFWEEKAPRGAGAGGGRIWRNICGIGPSLESLTHSTYSLSYSFEQTITFDCLHSVQTHTFVQTVRRGLGNIGAVNIYSIR